MARTAISRVDVGNQGSVNPISYDNGDATNNMKFANDGNTVLLIDNDTGGAATVTVTSVADQWGRTGDITLSMSAGDQAFVGPLDRGVWNQSSGTDQGSVRVDLNAAVNLVALRQST